MTGSIIQILATVCLFILTIIDLTRIVRSIPHYVTVKLVEYHHIAATTCQGHDGAITATHARHRLTSRFNCIRRQPLRNMYVLGNFFPVNSLSFMIVEGGLQAQKDNSPMHMPLKSGPSAICTVFLTNYSILDPQRQSMSAPPTIHSPGTQPKTGALAFRQAPIDGTFHFSRPIHHSLDRTV